MSEPVSLTEQEKIRKEYRDSLIKKIKEKLNEVPSVTDGGGQVGGGSFREALKKIFFTPSNRVAPAPAPLSAPDQTSAEIKTKLDDLPTDMLEEISKYLERDDKINLFTALPTDTSDPSRIREILNKQNPVNSYLAYTIYIALIRYINSYLNLIVVNDIKNLNFVTPDLGFKIFGNYIIFNLGNQNQKLVLMYYLIVRLRNNVKNYILKYKVKVVTGTTTAATAPEKYSIYNFKEEDELHQIVLEDDLMQSINNTSNVNIFINNILAAATAPAQTITFNDIIVKSADFKEQIYKPETPLKKLFSSEKKEKKLFLDALSQTVKSDFITKLIAQDESLKALIPIQQTAAAVAADKAEQELVTEIEALVIEVAAKPATVYDNPIPFGITQHLVKNQTQQKAVIYLQYLMYIIYEKCTAKDATIILDTINKNLEILDIFNLDNIDEIVDMVAFYSSNPSIPKIPVPTIKTFIREYNKAVGINKTELHLKHSDHYINIYFETQEAGDNIKKPTKLKKKKTSATIKKQ